MAIPRVRWNDNPTTLHTITAAIDQAGCCVVEDAIQNETAQAIRRELVAFDSAGSIGASAFEGHATRRTGAPLPRSATFRSIAMHPAVMCAGATYSGQRLDGDSLHQSSSRSSPVRRPNGCTATSGSTTWSIFRTKSS